MFNILLMTPHEMYLSPHGPWNTRFQPIPFNYATVCFSPTFWCHLVPGWSTCECGFELQRRQSNFPYFGKRIAVDITSFSARHLVPVRMLRRWILGRPSEQPQCFVALNLYVIMCSENANNVCQQDVIIRRSECKSGAYPFCGLTTSST